MQRTMGCGSRALAAVLAAVALWVFGTGGASAGSGQPSPWQKGMQDAATQVASEIHWFHDFVNVIIFAIVLFVLILLAIVILRFNERANPTPSRTTHHTGLEVAWTVIPIVILVIIAIPSFKLLYLQYSYPPPDLTLKAIGNAWNWDHQYPDHDNVEIKSTMLRDEDVLTRELGEKVFKERYDKLEGTALSRRLYADAAPLYAKFGLVRQLSVDNEIAVPENKVVHVLVTASDVIHNWTIPSFGSKVDAVPGRVTATWFKATRRGVYYGQCSELCGKDHSNMPITVRVLSQANFDSWIGAKMAAKKEPARRREHENRAREILQKAALEDGNSAVQFAGAAPAPSN